MSPTDLVPFKDDFFYPYAFVRFLRASHSTYLKAVKHFYGLALSPGEFATPNTANDVKLRRSHIPVETEYEWVRALVADQHELTHYLQLISTSTGILLFFCDAVYWDFCRDLLKRVAHRVGSEKKGTGLKTPLKTFLERQFHTNSLRTRYEFCQTLRGPVTIFNDSNVKITDAVEIWNDAALLLNDAERLPEDNIDLPQVAAGHDSDRPANPPGLTLRGILEAAARCKDLVYVKSYRVSEEVEERLVRELAVGEEYVSLLNRMLEIVPPQLGIVLLPRLCGIALQSPSTSLHAEESLMAGPVNWTAFAPTWRLEGLLQGIKSGEISAEGLVDEPNYPDEVCSKLGWPTLRGQRQRFLSCNPFHGTDSLVWFVMTRHTWFCRRAQAAEPSPVWLLDEDFRASISGDIDLFFPPYHFANGELIFHGSPAKIEWFGMYVKLLLAVAAKEMLGEGRLSTAREIHDALERVSNHNAEFREFWARFWPEQFYSSFGMRWSDVVEV